MKFTGLATGIPESEFSEDFVQGMADRSSVSFYKYGSAKDAFPSRVDAMASAYLGIAEYNRTGNKEYLMDAANFLMFEFMYPSLKDAYFKSTDSDGSPGRVRADGTIDQERNKREFSYKREGD